MVSVRVRDIRTKLIRASVRAITTTKVGERAKVMVNVRVGVLTTARVGDRAKVMTNEHWCIGKGRFRIIILRLFCVQLLV